MPLKIKNVSKTTTDNNRQYYQNKKGEAVISSNPESFPLPLELPSLCIVTVQSMLTASNRPWIAVIQQRSTQQQVEWPLGARSSRQIY